MVGKIKHFSRDPDGKGRGEGMYYWRHDVVVHNGRKMIHRHWAKRDYIKDGKIQAGNHPYNPSKSYGHTGDKNLHGRVGKRV